MDLNTPVPVYTLYIGKGDFSALIIIKSKCQSILKNAKDAIPPAVANLLLSLINDKTVCQRIVLRYIL